jgi:hypothetical protein
LGLYVIAVTATSSQIEMLIGQDLEHAVNAIAIESLRTKYAKSVEISVTSNVKDA